MFSATEKTPRRPNRATPTRLTPPENSGPAVEHFVAEDNVTNQRLAAINLESWGHRVTIADNGEKAVASNQRRKNSTSC